MRWLPPKSSISDFTRNQRINREFLEKVAQSGKWPQQACTSMFFLIPKNVTSERQIALMPTLIRWWGAISSSEMMKWQQRYRIGWDAIDGRNGGAERPVWEILVEMEMFKYRAPEEDQGASLLDLAKAFERVSLLVVWAWATHFIFPTKILRVCGYFEHQRQVQFAGGVLQPLQTITAILPGSK